MLGLRAFSARFLSAARTPRRTLRLRLTLLFAGMFLVCGAALLAVTYTLVSHGITGGEGIALHGGGRGGIKTPPPTLSMPNAPPRVLRVLESSAGQEFLRVVETQQRVEELHQLEIESAIALGIMAILSGLLGWVAAGRVLRPLRTITATTRDISATSLDKRLALQRPEDELKDLGDTIDALLTLARSQQGIEHREHINLGEVSEEVVGAARPSGTDEGIMIDTALSPAWVSSDPRLIR